MTRCRAPTRTFLLHGSLLSGGQLRAFMRRSVVADPMKNQTLNNSNTHLARSVGPEDLRRGAYVALLNETYEFPSFLWCCDSPALAIDETVRVRFRPLRPGYPLRVVEICLPFVLVDQPQGGRFSLDVRQCQLVVLKKRFAKSAWKIGRGKKSSRCR